MKSPYLILKHSGKAKTKRHQYFSRCCVFFVLNLIIQVKYLQAQELVVEVELRDHLFFPSTIVIPAGERVSLLIINQDPTPEEFESTSLNREKVITGYSRTVVHIGPLAPGEYPFFGEFFPKTAQGVVLAK